MHNFSNKNTCLNCSTTLNMALNIVKAISDKVGVVNFNSRGYNIDVCINLRKQEILSIIFHDERILQYI